MIDPRDEFSLRVRRLNKKRRKSLRKSGRALIDRDGYVIVRGYRERRSIPLTGLMLLMAGFFGLKGVMMAQLGPDNYATRIDTLGEGRSAAVAMGVWTMQPDPVSTFVAQHLKGML
ncbi:hypothetical protein N6L24_10900 [Cognatishimia sp. SS12]|uniref:hypothetical protein n=1 Tax=Cognatishimia sp. SS12 TaxID=2979465 RepID=UPI00232C2826|nr:hypothetical protein [Cognatishimia sp. SS12]MDC0738790.1 hypothetical protein [Cognatishimia sp. SS12]